MGCFVLVTQFLQFLEGKLSQGEYEFACKHIEQKKQDNVSYFILELDQQQLYLQQDQCQDNPSQIQKVLLAGILYDHQQNVAGRVKHFILNSYKDSLYFKLGQYEEGFKNLILSLKDYLHSADSQKSYANKYEYSYGKYEDMMNVNLMMKLNNKIYLSKSLGNSIQIQNKWLISLNQQKGSYNQIQINDLINSYSEYFILKEDIADQVEGIILSSTQCSNQMITADVRQLFPRQEENDYINQVFFLKLKNLK